MYTRATRGGSHGLKHSACFVSCVGVLLALQTPFKFPDKDGMSDVTSRTVVVRERRQHNGLPIGVIS